VLLDIYRNKKASEVRIPAASDLYKEDMTRRIADAKQRGDGAEVSKLKTELKATYARMKGEEKAEKVRILAEEKEAERLFEMEMNSREGNA